MKILYLVWVFSPVGLWSIARKQRAPCDTSNRFNKLILLWFAFTRYRDLKYATGLNVSQAKMISLATFREEKFSHVFLWLKVDTWEFLNKR